MAKSKKRNVSQVAAFAVVFAALGDPTRLALVTKLAEGTPRSITRLAEDTDMTRQAVTKHLHVLEDAGVVETTKAGRESLYSIRPAAFDDVQAYLAEVSAQWDAALARLKTFVGETP
jgi:DNA-binding transcriptional ArsR family regulator